MIKLLNVTCDVQLDFVDPCRVVDPYSVTGANAIMYGTKL